MTVCLSVMGMHFLFSGESAYLFFGLNDNMTNQLNRLWTSIGRHVIYCSTMWANCLPAGKEIRLAFSREENKVNWLYALSVGKRYTAFRLLWLFSA